MLWKDRRGACFFSKLQYQLVAVFLDINLPTEAEEYMCGVCMPTLFGFSLHWL